MVGEPDIAWQDYLGQEFPGYLLPAAMRQTIDARIAQRFLSRLDPRANMLELLLSSSLLAGYGQQVREFCDTLAELVRVLPSRTHVDRRYWEGHFHGRLAVAATMKLRAGGAPTRFVTHTRRGSFDLPENELVHYVARRLLGLVANLRKEKLLPKMPSGEPTKRSESDTIPWKQQALACEAELEYLLLKTVLGQVPALETLTTYHEQAAQAALHPCYEEALAWYRRINEAMDERDPNRIADILSQGALWPHSADTQFEIAVLIKLIKAIERVCEPAGWRFERSIVMHNRESIARFHRDDGACIEVYYNQADMLPKTGPRNAGLAYYFANKGRFRPDVTVIITRPGLRPRAVVFEVKHSDNKSYLQKGYQEALLYRYEYADHLLQWPKAVLVCSGSISRPVSRKHDVVAVDWNHWVPDAIVEAIVPTD